MVTIVNSHPDVNVLGVTSCWKDPSQTTEIQAGVSSPPPALCLMQSAPRNLQAELCFLWKICHTNVFPFHSGHPVATKFSKGMMACPHSALLKCPQGKKQIKSCFFCHSVILGFFSPKTENVSQASHLSQSPDHTPPGFFRVVELWLVCSSPSVCHNVSVCPQGLFPAHQLLFLS